MAKCKYCGVSGQGEICNLCKQELSLIRKMKIILLDPDGDPGEQICASYIFKAGFGKEPTLAEAVAEIKRLENELEESKTANSADDEVVQELSAEIERLKKQKASGTVKETNKKLREENNKLKSKLSKILALTSNETVTTEVVDADAQ